MEQLIPKHGGYRNLKTFQLARVVYDVTLRFCEKFVGRRSRTYDQMVQAARSGVQNIAEGSEASATSKKTELKLTNVARASLVELKLDYEDFLRQHSYPTWERTDPRRSEIINARFSSADQIAWWVKSVHQKHSEPIPQIAANTMVVLISVTCHLLSRQINSQAEAFKHEGGFTEKLYHARKAHRNTRP